MKTLRRHLSYANVVATLALVFAMTGGALAASHYLINSTKQISPKVLKKLKGNRGAAGARGLAGPRGLVGPQGATGTLDPSKFFSKAESDGRYLGKGEQAADSAKLAGVAASGYTTGEGTQGGRWLELIDKGEEANFLSVPGIGELGLKCTQVAPNPATSVQLTQHAGSAVFLTWGSYPDKQPTKVETAVLKADNESLAKGFGPTELGTGQIVIQASAVGTSVHTYATITASASVTEGFCRFQANYTVAQQRF
jgi:hypothetical protein